MCERSKKYHDNRSNKNASNKWLPLRNNWSAIICWWVNRNSCVLWFRCHFYLWQLFWRFFNVVCFFVVLRCDVMFLLFHSIDFNNASLSSSSTSSLLLWSSSSSPSPERLFCCYLFFLLVFWNCNTFIIAFYCLFVTILVKIHFRNGFHLH